MKKGLLAIFAVFALCNICYITHAQTLTKYAKQRNQDLVDLKLKEKANYEKACKEGTLSSLNDYLSKYPKGKYVQDVKKRIDEIEKKKEQDMYDYATKVETEQAYVAYLKKYPNGIFATEAKGRIEDMELWKKAKTTNTIDAYHSYLKASKNKSFAQLANDAITDLKSKEEWEVIKHSPLKSIIEDFILKYPKSSCLSDATKRHDELLGVEYYEQGYLQRAYEKFEAAGGRYKLESSNRIKYDECQEYVEYKKLSSSSKESDLLAFLKKYPSSLYFNQVSNMVAIAKAKNLSMFASSYNFNEALSYAKDKETRNTVQSYIDSSKRSYSHYKRQQRHNRVMANGGYIKMGFEIMDFAVAGFSGGDSNQKTLYYNVGLSVKFGNYKSPIQFEVGIKPGVVYSIPKAVFDSYGYNTKKEKTFFHMPVFSKLKINLCDAGSSKMYIAGIGAYNAVRDNAFENEFSVGGGLGFSWKKWDWFALYYKQDVENKLNIDDKYIGSSIVYYF